MSKDTITVGLIVEPDNKVLLLQRNSYPCADYVDPFGEKWELIGGHIEADEEPIKAALREIMEETGILVTWSFLELVEVIPFNGNTAMNYIYVCRVSRIVGMEPPITLSNEHIAFKYVSISDAQQTQLAFAHNNALNAIVNRKKDTAPFCKTTRRKCRVQIQERNRYATTFNVTKQYPSDALPEWFAPLQSIVEDTSFTNMIIRNHDVRYHISIVKEEQHT